jgi:hypothetical protein
MTSSLFRPASFDQGVGIATPTFIFFAVVGFSVREHSEGETSLLARQVLDVMPMPSFSEHLGSYLDLFILSLCSDLPPPFNHVVPP